MKRFKIIACFLLVFSLTFSEESSREAEQKARIAQLEQQIETQNKIIARYERLEDKLNDRVLETLDLNNKVDDFYNSAWTKLLIVVTGAFAGIGLLLPYLQNKSFRDTKERIERQEEELQKHQEFFNDQKEILNKQEKKIDENLGETNRLFALNIFQSSIVNEKYADFRSNGEFGFEYIFKAIKYYSQVSNQKGVEDSVHVIYCVLYENEEREKKEEKNYWSDLVTSFKGISKRYPTELFLVKECVENLDSSDPRKKDILLKFLREI